MSAENNEKRKEERKESGKVEVLRLTLSYFWDDVGEDLLKAVGLLFLIAGCAAAVWFAASYPLAFVITLISVAILGYLGYRLHDAYYWAKQRVARETTEEEKEHRQDNE